MLAQADCQFLPLAPNSVDLIFCDPPYLREYLPCYGWLAQEAARVLKPGGFVLAMCGGAYLDDIFSMFRTDEMKFYWKYEMDLTGARTGIVWRHNGAGENTTIVVRTKPILAYSKGGGKARTSTMGTFRDGGADKAYHSWGQAVASARYFIDCFSAPGDLVVDPFIGGGTTAVACELIGRRCLGLDIDPAALATSATRLSIADILHTMPLFQFIP